MRLIGFFLLSIVVAGAQNEDEFKVYTEHPRLLLKPQRLRLLKRERERQSARWTQFDSLVRGNAQMPEPAFALALFYAVSGEEDFGKRAVAAASREETDARQVAVVYDWCQPLLDDGTRAALEGRLRRSARASVADFEAARNAAFAAIAVGDAAALKGVIAGWWTGTAAKELVAGTRVLRPADAYPFAELSHAIRDNLQIELREDARAAFQDLANRRLLEYYPAVYPASENEYRIPYYLGKGEPDLRVAALSRAADLSFVAYDNNAQDMQFLQGWLMHDRFMLRGPLGAPYEFLWANPYQPGLPFEKMKLWLHDERTGTLLARSSWDEDATWVGIFGASSQMFREGRVQPFSPREGVVIGEAAITPTTTFRVTADSAPNWFVVGVKPATVYDVEVDDEDMTDAVSDRGGILALEFTRADGQRVYVHLPRRAQ